MKNPLIFLILHLALTIQVGAQDFQTGIENIFIPVLVLDNNDQPVRDLTVNKFEVYESNVKKEINFFAAVNPPLDVYFFVDNSNSMNLKWQFLVSAIKEFVPKLRDIDRVKFITVSNPSVHSEWLMDTQSIITELQGIKKNSGATHIYRELYTTLTDLKKQRGGEEIRKTVFILISDGKDNDNLDFKQKSRIAVGQTPVVIYTILVQDRNDQFKTSGHQLNDFNYEWRQLSQLTAGRAFEINLTKRPESELKRIYATIVEEFSNQYFISYESQLTGSPQPLVQIAVKVGDYKVKHRPGFIPNSPKL